MQDPEFAECNVKNVNVQMNENEEDRIGNAVFCESSPFESCEMGAWSFHDERHRCWIDIASLEEVSMSL